MASLEVLLNGTVSAFSRRASRLRFIQDIDLALKEVESVYSTLKAANRSPVKQALKLFRSRSSSKPNTQVLKDENASAVSLAQEVASGRRDLVSLKIFELLLLRRALRTRRNSLASISRLPTEILTPILELCPTIDADKPDFKTGKFVLGLTVSHVCRRWREIALKSSYFWSNIVLSRPRWALEMLHRSRAAPLTVGADFGSPHMKNIAARGLVLAQLSRIRGLHLNMPNLRSPPAPLLLPAPLLESFFLWYAGPSVVFVRAKLFQGEVTSLHHLSLRYCLLDGESPLWENLVSLELINAPINVGMEEFLTIVHTKMPHLRTLTLNESFPETSQTSETIMLDLETLELTGSTLPCYWFLSAVSIPKCHIVLNVPYTVVDLRFVWDALESHRAGATDPVLCGLKVTDLPPTSDGASLFEVALFNQTSRSNAPCKSPRYTVRLAGSVPPLSKWREEAMCTMMTIMSLDQVTNLTMKCEGLKLATSLLHLKHFRSAAFHRNVEPFTEQLEGDPLMTAGDRFDPVNNAVHYPRLRRLTFLRIAFTERNMEIILDWLAQRKRLNMAMDEIRLISCTLTTADLGSLKELVGHIVLEDGRL